MGGHPRDCHCISSHFSACVNSLNIESSASPFALACCPFEPQHMLKNRLGSSRAGGASSLSFGWRLRGSGPSPSARVLHRLLQRWSIDFDRVAPRSLPLLPFAPEISLANC